MPNAITLFFYSASAFYVVSKCTNEKSSGFRTHHIPFPPSLPTQNRCDRFKSSALSNCQPQNSIENDRLRETTIVGKRKNQMSFVLREGLTME